MFQNLLRIFTSKPARGAVSAGLLIFILYKFGAGQILNNILSADPIFFASAVLVFIVSGIAGAKQWGILLGFHGIHLGFRGTVSRYFMGLFFNYVLPGVIGGDIIRVYQAAKASGKTTSAFSSTLADRVMGLLILVLFSLCGFLFLPSGPSMEALPVAVFMFLLLCGFIGLFALKPAGRIMSRAFGRFLPGEIRLKLSAVYHEMHQLTRAPSILLAILGTSIFIQLTRIGVHFLCGRAVGIELGFMYFALFVPLMEITASIPISLGGVGVREMMAVILFSTVGVSQATVVSYTFLAYSSGFIGALPGSVAFMMSIKRGKKDPPGA
ncbi:MAG: lysylphosphatidylglycerol synthase transmembrane domain-containing protein [Candidatus Latescibacter sp.]|nr:lysylphosphatidylglycerol synthase transmembrane domain-containing protein [Candidatus Latescibacter sp.]